MKHDLTRLAGTLLLGGLVGFVVVKTFGLPGVFVVAGLLVAIGLARGSARFDEIVQNWWNNPR